MLGRIKNKKNQENSNIVRKGKKWERFQGNNSLSQKSAKSDVRTIKPINNKPRKVATPKEKFSFRDLINKFLDFRLTHDRRVFYALLSLIFIGIICIYSASIVPAHNVFGDKFYFIEKHIKFLLIGSVGLIFCYFIRVELISKLWFIPLGLSIALLFFLLVMSFVGRADSFNGANRWFSVGASTFQPSEFAKLAFVIFVSAFLSTRKTHYKDFKEYVMHNLLPYSLWFFLILGLIVGGKNLSTAIIIGFVGVSLYGISAVTHYQKKAFLGLMIFGVVCAGLLAMFEGYRAERLKVYTNYWKTGDTYFLDENGSAYIPDSAKHFNVALSSAGAGGLWGVGLGKSTGKYHLYYTSAGDDLIISVIAEELGFVLTAMLILLYFYLIYRCFTLASKLVDKPTHSYLLMGCAMWIGFQAFTHIAANFGVIPLTGQTLPFISIGGSSLISLMCAAGIILNVTKSSNSNDAESNSKIIKKAVAF